MTTRRLGLAGWLLLGLLALAAMFYAMEPLGRPAAAQEPQAVRLAGGTDR